MSERLEAALIELAAALRAEIRGELAATDAPVELLSVEEAARRAGISRTLFYAQIMNGKVRSLRVGRRRLVPATELAKLVEAVATLFLAEDASVTATFSQSSTVAASALQQTLGASGGRPTGGAFARAGNSDSDEPVPGNNCKLECDRNLLNCLDTPGMSEALCRFSWSLCYENCRGGPIGGFGVAGGMMG